MSVKQQLHLSTLWWTWKTWSLYHIMILTRSAPFATFVLSTRSSLKLRKISFKKVGLGITAAFTYTANIHCSITKKFRHLHFFIKMSFKPTCYMIANTEIVLYVYLIETTEYTFDCNELEHNIIKINAKISIYNVSRSYHIIFNL